MELIIENLSKSYKDKKVVENISLSLKQGVYGLLGANGAGKTTLMRMICGILKADTGSVTFDGISTLFFQKSYSPNKSGLRSWV